MKTRYKFFRASRSLMDIAESRDLPSLQTIICMILFLQSTAKLSTCWSYVGIALHSAIRMGLHRSIAGAAFNPIEIEIRKRMFWQIRKMDIYVGAMLGLPTMLSDDDIDQEEPLEIDDECLTVDRILPMSEDRVPLMAATNAHLRLIRILQRIMHDIYPIKNTQHLRGKAQSYVISYSTIREIERDLHEWMENLPMSLRPGGTVSPRLERCLPNDITILRKILTPVQVPTAPPHVLRLPANVPLPALPALRLQVQATHRPGRPPRLRLRRRVRECQP